MIRCTACRSPLVDEDTWNQWHWLATYFHIELLEGNITEATYQEAMDKLMSFKRYAMGEEGSGAGE
jgi:hypothetical protein